MKIEVELTKEELDAVIQALGAFVGTDVHNNLCLELCKLRQAYGQVSQDALRIRRVP